MSMSRPPEASPLKVMGEPPSPAVGGFGLNPVAATAQRLKAA